MSTSDWLAFPLARIAFASASTFSAFSIVDAGTLERAILDNPSSKSEIVSLRIVLSATVSVEDSVVAASVFSSLAWDEAVSSLASLVRTGAAS